MPYSRQSAEARQPGPPVWLVLALCAVYLLAGLTGHDPWKSEDAIHLGIAHDVLVGGNWLVPTLAGEPWADAAPLYHWLAAASGAVWQFLLPFHDAARLASAFFGALFLAMLAGAARRFYGPAAGWGAPLLAIGTLGLLVPIHEAQPTAAILAAIAALYWGAARLADRPATGALLMGAGLGASFLAGGASAALPLLPLLLLPLAQRRWLALAVAVAASGLVAASWPLLLAWREPAFLGAWWSAQLASVAPHGGFSIDHAQWLGWFAWPVLFIAPWAVWRGRRQLSAPPLAVPLLGIAGAAIWFLGHEPKTLATLPLLPPLILLASSAVITLRRGAANAWDWFGMMTFTIIAALVWLGAVAMLTGWPPKLAHNFARLEPGFVDQWSLPALLVALLASGAWLLVLWRLPRAPWRVASRWAAGVTVAWTLITTLWMPWIDYGKTYRPVVAALRQALPADHGCIGRHDLGAPQRAALDYFAGLRTQAAGQPCRWLVAQGGAREKPPAGWQKVWEGHRPGDRNEWLRLYRRADS
jgi:4-amino-4-deoxy-L-arabinose transferase-like glycosyltransferase